MNWILKQARVIDPSRDLDQVMDLYVEEGQFVDQAPGQAQECSLDGLVVMPGLVDIGPAFNNSESLASGAQAAVSGGVTTVALLPNSSPPVDSEATVEYVSLVSERLGLARLRPLATLTKGRAGQEAVEMGLLSSVGAIGFTDAPEEPLDASSLYLAMHYARGGDHLILTQPELKNIRADGVCHEGLVSTRTGLAPIPAVAEEIALARDLMLAADAQIRLHVLGITTAQSLRLLKTLGSDQISASIPAANLIFNDSALQDFNKQYKLLPPLRFESDRQALVQALKNGELKAIHSGHRPLPMEEHQWEFGKRPFGGASLECYFSALFHSLGEDSLPLLARACSLMPGRILGLEAGGLGAGHAADFFIFDPKAEWTPSYEQRQGQGASSPFDGQTWKGQVKATFRDGRVVYGQLPEKA